MQSSLGDEIAFFEDVRKRPIAQYLQFALKDYAYVWICLTLFIFMSMKVTNDLGAFICNTKRMRTNEKLIHYLT
jgi:hypothetical protein